jgi:hypothetical protein
MVGFDGDLLGRFWFGKFCMIIRGIWVRNRLLAA